MVGIIAKWQEDTGGITLCLIYDIAMEYAIMAILLNLEHYVNYSKQVLNKRP